MKPKQVKRLHSEDARLLRALLLDVVARLIEAENAIGHLQRVTFTDVPAGAEVVEN